MDATAATLVGEKTMVLDSTGMAWVTSWVDGGTLIEGPEAIKHGGYYYLFFAGGRYCQVRCDFAVAFRLFAVILPVLTPWVHVSFIVRVCRQDSYSEGVARSSSLTGPYAKMQSPLLSTSLVGSGSGGQKIIGPGHASFVQDATDPDLYFVVYAASLGENCNRLAFVERMRFNNATGWPYIDFEAPHSASLKASGLSTSGVDNRAQLAKAGPRPGVTTEAAAPATARIRRVVAPCSVLAAVELPRWRIPTAAACTNTTTRLTTERCYGIADGSGAVCTV